MGDAAGIGPEVIVTAWENSSVHEACQPVVIGHPEIIRRAANLRHLPLRIIEVSEPRAALEIDADPRQLVCLRNGGDEILEVPVGTVHAATGRAAFESVRQAAELAKAGIFDGLVTAPINKAALHAAGLNYPGHTELLAEICGVDNFAMMLYVPSEVVPRCPQGLGVVHTTLHMSVRNALEVLSVERIRAACHLIHNAMNEFGIARPRIGVCALNPHAGEAGLFGDEETRLIEPAIKEAQAAGINAAGPYPADTLLVRARDGEFDAVVAMIHDQGHIAVKLMAMHSAVNVTLGLPIVRTSVAHGTAFDRAWQGTARAEGMVSAILTAAQIARHRREK
jgi:4-hydroxythreonine-4-phosphate dehydrogenase